MKRDGAILVYLHCCMIEVAQKDTYSFLLFCPVFRMRRVTEDPSFSASLNIVYFRWDLKDMLYVRMNSKSDYKKLQKEKEESLNLPEGQTDSGNDIYVINVQFCRGIYGFLSPFRRTSIIWSFLRTPTNQFF